MVGVPFLLEGLQGSRPGQGSFVHAMPALAVECISPALAVFRSPAPVVESVAPAPAVVFSPAPVGENFTRARTVSSVSACDGVQLTRTLGVSFPCACKWRSRGEGTFQLLRHSEGAKFFQFWQNERLLATDNVNGLVLRLGQSGRTWRFARPRVC